MPDTLPAGTVPLQCSCDSLQQAQARLEGLVARCDERWQALSQAFDALPAAARFDPFAVEVAAADEPADAPPAAAARRRAAVPPSPVAAARERTDPQAVPRPGTRAAAQEARAPRRAAEGRADAAAADADGLPSSLPSWVAGPVALAALGGEQVAALMERFAAQAGGLGMASLGQAVVASLPKALLGQTGEWGPAVARAVAELPPAAVREDRATPAGLAGADLGELTRQVLAAPGLLPRGMGASFAAAGGLAAMANAGLGAAVQAGLQAPATRAPQAPARAAAPRAPSRLLPAGAAPAPEPTSSLARAGAALGEGLEDTGEALAGQLNRLLLDQAWMRGVDLK